MKLLKGTLDILILKTLSCRAMHGYAIARSIRETSSEVLRVEEGVLYPALHRLERDGLLEAGWGKNDTGRRAKFYSVTARGREQLSEEVARWRRSSRAVTTVLEATEA